MVVVRSEVGLGLDGILRRRRVVLGGIWGACGVEGAGGGLQRGAVAICRSRVVLNCARSHDGGRW